ncbi:hydrogenase maturation nickel metallochaperone HypA [Aestuariirhabdus sp. Z084]|uniref:hydrogenase maturation nickel metallochaperone HypA n=1 Tax=Aestuariirhabdus haliotis TaxID=2918751 RepID=UPI00201B4057|nr:hydrogenase maturation nickel metallochaperone HypA [Aestuariirhabdus haliotis]MCL6415154.1 hydrogenase maturation nickel metallochaperone HypA [Aestuariirhabdus haliotis]MCL6420029.1 hydrogenase maturation nickel metallochaperone HypA [Aestuariirhabdus haliotis]
MHEMSLAEGVIQILEEYAMNEGFSRVKTVWLEVGQLSNVEVDSFRFCFEVVCRGTLAENATLEVIETPGRGYCLDCCQSVEHSQRFDPCPQCNGYKVQATEGSEMRVKELEVE